ncbi:MAG: PhnE/PtxC family ABC transporter permease [Verrucomicrobiales bacterium]
MTHSSPDRQARIDVLRRGRSRSRFVEGSALLMLGLTVWAWLSAGKLTGRLPFARRWQNFLNFLGDLTPSPVRKSGDWSESIPWAWDLFTDKGFTALAITIGIACAAIILSTIFVLPFLPLASRQLGRRDPFGIFSGKKTNQQGQKLARPRSEDGRNLQSQDVPVTNIEGKFDEPTLLDRKSPSSFDFRGLILGPATRFLFVLARAIPEYILAFLLISLLGLQFWPLVLALAIHNFGILGRLFSEVVENADTRAAEQAFANGFGRKKVFGLVIFPAVFNRFLIYFFYRWETCVKDATVLGMLGVLTLGHLMMMTKGFFWDRMLFYVLLGSSVIMVGDLLSTWIRQRLRR